MIVAIASEPRLSWNLVDDVRQLFEFPFMVNAFRAGTIVAIVAGLVGWFMVLRKQTFAGHTLALIGFPGGAGAALVGASVQLGFFAFCVAGAIAIALLPRGRGSTFGDESAVIATVQVFALASGFLFVSLHGGNLNSVNSLLFGSILGITEGDVLRVLIAAIVVLAVVGAIARPLLFASIDPDVAAARGVPVRLLALGFTVLLGVAAAASVQITGALLVFTLLVIPAAAAHALTSRPSIGVVLSVGLALMITWLGLGVAYYSPYPIGFWTTTFAFAVFLAARVTAWRMA
jgi:zinc/manganese transport system permease protein